MCDDFNGENEGGEHRVENVSRPSGGCADRYALIVFAPRELTVTFSHASEATS